MSADLAGWLRREIDFHVRHHFRAEAGAALGELAIAWGRLADLPGNREARLLVPIDVGTPQGSSAPWRVPFHGTTLTLWNRVPTPEGWNAWPGPDAPLWYVDGNARAMAAWDLYGNLVSLLGLEEERRSARRDPHGRFIGSMSPRDRAGLLEVPAFNEAVAALVALALAFREGRTGDLDRLDSALEPPALILSHDCDQLRGDDRFTQAARAWHLLRPLLRGQAPDLRAGRAIVENARAPHRFYLDSIPAMLELEKAAGARSSFYFLNGAGGRFGARSGSGEVARARALVPAGWSVGMHYNYDTFLNPAAFDRQRTELEALIGGPVRGGRAHYLRIDPQASLPFLEGRGMLYDESLGYPDRVGYRAGIAGAFHPAGAPGIVEIPLVIMDGTLQSQYPGQGTATFRQLLCHLSRIGGSLTYLLHPGRIGNPETDDGDARYGDLLEVARSLGARFRLPMDFVETRC